MPVRCWKHASGESIFQIENHLRFYRELTRRATRTGRLRLVLARRDGRDLAYCFGIVAGATYRGLQMSYDAAHEKLGLLVLRKSKTANLLTDKRGQADVVEDDDGGAKVIRNSRRNKPAKDD